MGGVDGEGGYIFDKGGYFFDFCCFSGFKGFVLNSFIIVDILLIVYYNFFFRLKKKGKYNYSCINLII